MKHIDYPATPLAPRYFTIEYEPVGRFDAIRELELIGLTRYEYQSLGCSIKVVAAVYRERIMA